MPGRRPLTAVGAQSPAATQSRVLDGPQHTAAIINFSLTDSDTHNKGTVIPSCNKYCNIASIDI